MDFIDWDESTDLNDKMLNLLYSFSVNMKPIWTFDVFDWNASLFILRCDEV